MLNTQRILLASHGTPGAMAAVTTSLSLCSDKTGAELFHLVVVPDFWLGMTGDDWLNNGSTRDRYRRYLETELGKEIDEHCQLVQDLSEQQGTRYERTILFGKPDQCLIDFCKEENFDLVVMGSPRPKGVAGLRSRMHAETLAKNLHTPILMVPFPHD